MINNRDDSITRDPELSILKVAQLERIQFHVQGMTKERKSLVPPAANGSYTPSNLRIPINYRSIAFITKAASRFSLLFLWSLQQAATIVSQQLNYFISQPTLLQSVTSIHFTCNLMVYYIVHHLHYCHQRMPYSVEANKCRHMPKSLSFCPTRRLLYFSGVYVLHFCIGLSYKIRGCSHEQVGNRFTGQDWRIII